MAVQKTNINRYIKDAPKRHASFPKPPQKEGFINSPIFQMAEGMLNKMPTKYKVLIGGAIYLIVSGVVGNVVGIIKLINLIF